MAVTLGSELSSQGKALWRLGWAGWAGWVPGWQQGLPGRAGRAAMMPVVAAHVPHSPLKVHAPSHCHALPLPLSAAISGRSRGPDFRAGSGQLLGFLSLILSHGFWGGSWASIPEFSHTDGGLCPVSPKVHFDRLEVLGSHFLSLRTLTVPPGCVLPASSVAVQAW